MKVLRYTLLGEGIAEDKFIPEYLKKMGQQKNIRTIKSRLRISDSSSPSSSKVLAKMAQFCQQSLIQQEDDLFIAGVDLDEADHADEKHSVKLKELENKLSGLYQSYSNQIILFVPIQCMDHWLYYQHYKVSGTKKQPANSLESTDCDDIKERLYGRTINRAKIEKAVSEVLHQCNFDELAKQSRSFRHFHKQINQFLAKFTSYTDG